MKRVVGMISSLPAIAVATEIILTYPFKLDGNTLKTGDGRIYVIDKSVKIGRGDIEMAKKIKVELDEKGAIKKVKILEFWEEENEEGGRRHEIEKE